MIYDLNAKIFIDRQAKRGSGSMPDTCRWEDGDVFQQIAGSSSAEADPYQERLLHRS